MIAAWSSVNADYFYIKGDFELKGKTKLSEILNGLWTDGKEQHFLEKLQVH